ncbi:serine hydrolase domain-containing protein [Streptoalloteichus hindustanus]|uniref:CubicO group peptidase, beta-lactamase class C family n=1 Tax=Streptoalloteichus hindustanus TaxID=2017 RepID=A0A1M5IH83_STRHI|nr:serine hydrolase domain-containing protein [Streptoalloteichus hindustanus]SHG27153.1 CubicO group peptidase, beta-lactamase class C family [Streptoalloteichus hindustanus]
MNLENRLNELMAEHRVPGAVLGVYANGEYREHAAGVLNTRTGVEVTTDSLFQIGSMTKVVTATLAMRLVEEGVLNLDLPVRTYLPDFRLADDSAAARITTRHLLCHTAGFEGDVFTDTGRGDDALARYVDLLGTAPQIFQPGELFSYNNAGFCVLGRIIETLHDKPYVQCLHDDLIQPLNLTRTATDADQAILHRAAVGHLGDPPQPAGIWALPRSLAPAGSALAMSARDVLTFTRALLTGSVLDAETVRTMWTEHMRLSPATGHGDAWSLGWEVFHVDGRTIYGHNGDTVGQSAFLRLIPDHDIAVVLLTNGGEAVPLHHELLTHVLRDLADIDLPALPTPTATTTDPSPYLGTYANSLTQITITREDNTIWAEQTPVGEYAGSAPPQRLQLLPHTNNSLITAHPSQGIHHIYHFLGDPQGPARFLHTGRALPRIPLTQQ